MKNIIDMENSIKNIKKVIFNISFLLAFSCKESLTNDEIKQLLKSNNVENMIIGAFKAGETQKKEFVPLLLLNADNPSVCLNIHYKGYSVYQAKMMALKKIFKVSPPDTLTRIPDSTNIKFYINLANK